MLVSCVVFVALLYSSLKEEPLFYQVLLQYFTFLYFVVAALLMSRLSHWNLRKALSFFHDCRGAIEFFSRALS